MRSYLLHLISGGGDNTVKVWDISTGECLQTINHVSMVLNVTVSLGGSKLYVGDNNCNFNIF